MRFLYILIACFFLNACADLEKSEHLARIETLEASIIGIESELQEVVVADSAWISRASYLVEELKKFESDTITVEMAKKMNTFKRLHETVPVAIELRHQILEAISSEKADLEKLRSDISKGDGRRGKYKDYVSSEKSKCDVISREYKRYNDMLTGIHENLENTTAEIESMVNERKTREEVQ